VALSPFDFEAFPTAPDWSAATVELSCMVAPHTSESPSGHSLTLIALAFHSAMTAPQGYDYDIPHQQPLCSGDLAYDGGTPGWHHATNEGYGMAVRFTPASYPWTFDQAEFWPWSSSGGLDFEVHVWDDDGPGGSPGSNLITPFVHHAVATDQWEEVGLPSIGIESGEFYIGWIQPVGGLYYNAIDGDLTPTGRSYILSSDGSWKNLTEIGEDRDMMIRQSCR
jgi:hypothetical protein